MRVESLKMLGAAALALTLFVPHAMLSQNWDKAEAALKFAMDKEVLEGNLKAAIEQYKKLTLDANKSVAARAMVRLGECYEKQGSGLARQTYEQVLSRFGDQKESTETARAHLAALGRSDAVGPSIRRMDISPGAISPDGKTVLMYKTETIDLRDLATGRTRPLIKRPATDAEFSSDGRQVLYIRHLSDADAPELHVIGSDGSGERLVWKGEKGSWVFWPQWFPDGKRVLLPYTAGKGVHGKLIAVSTADSSITTLSEGKSFPRLSPDGLTLLFERGGPANVTTEQLWLRRLADGKETLLFDAKSYVGYPQWTPDGSGVVFMSDRRSPGQTVDLWLLRLAEGKAAGFPEIVQKDLGKINNGETDAYPRSVITHNGAYYFSKRRGINRELLTVDFDPESGRVNGTPTYVSRNPGETFSPSFTSDGRLLSYLRQSEPPATLLVIQTVATGEEKVVSLWDPDRRLYPTGAMIFPDGKSVLLAVSPLDGIRFYRVDIATGKWTPLKRTVSDLDTSQGAISPDGGTFYFTRGGTPDNVAHLFAREVETGVERDIKTLPPAGSFNLSPDGKLIATTRGAGKDSVVEVMPAAGGAAREVYRVQGIAATLMDWEPDGQHLIVLCKETGGDSFWRVSIQAGPAQPIGISTPLNGSTSFPKSLGKLAVSPSGRQIVYTARAEPTDGVFVLENFLPPANGTRK